MEVEEYPTDVSVYEARGMAGNVRDWTSTEEVQGEGESARRSRVVRGGAWGNYRINPRCAARASYVPASVNGTVGFRVVGCARRTRP